MINPIPREQNIEESQVICLDNICKVDGSWTSTTQDEELKTARDFFAFGNGSTAIGNGEYASTFVMPELGDELQGSDRNDKGTSRLANLVTQTTSSLRNRIAVCCKKNEATRRTSLSRGPHRWVRTVSDSWGFKILTSGLCRV
ncbi:hypothetical protein F2Q69_00045724 [Brassica cretica]|uniref:Uncharacterized protein n=1 Tax=Brassica cretica TaxID=69181 RepID=A0A8S9NCW1_BRACR|nr:hypothetical protein F2Q69_00045724 [Brassica cretica]